MFLLVVLLILSAIGEVIGCRNSCFVPVKSFTGKIERLFVSNMTYSVLKPTLFFYYYYTTVVVADAANNNTNGTLGIK